MTHILPGLRHLPYVDRLKSLGLLTLHTRRLRHDLVFVYKLLHGMVDLDASKFFTLAHDNRTRGHDLKLQVGYSRLLLRRNFFSQRIVSLWNNLPSACIDAPSLQLFKSSLRMYFEQNGFRQFQSSVFHFCMAGSLFPFLSSLSIVRITVCFYSLQLPFTSSLFLPPSISLSLFLFLFAFFLTNSIRPIIHKIMLYTLFLCFAFLRECL